MITLEGKIRFYRKYKQIMITIKPQDFIVDSETRLTSIPTELETDATKKEMEKALKKVGRALAKIQDRMYAHNRYGVLICIQGMDTSGKDSLVREVFKSFNPRGVIVHSFKTPHSKELKHDYIWRHYVALPEKGKFAVFNRSHYENVLVTRVNPHFLLNENMPGIETVDEVPDDLWEKRYRQIINFERHITENGIVLFKFFLHLSKEEQRSRLVRRLEKQKHNWKFTPNDIAERALWERYQVYYDEVINRTSTPFAPWFIVPADNKQTARYIVARVLLEEMEKYTDIREPELDESIRENLSNYRQQLMTGNGN
jgi:PPK2 family polyphosphate:nucleotide phosphotransferase